MTQDERPLGVPYNGNVGELFQRITESLATVAVTLHTNQDGRLVALVAIVPGDDRIRTELLETALEALKTAMRCNDAAKN